MAEHRLKTWPEFFAPLLSGTKTFELRPNDRDFKTGDRLLLQEFEPSSGYSGRVCERLVTGVLCCDPWGVIKSGWCILSITIPEDAAPASTERDNTEAPNA